MKQYTVIYERGLRNWSAYVPDLPGCIAAGDTRSEVEQLIREAIEFHVEGLRLHGEPIPEPSIEAGEVSVSV
ncbi:MAG: type II toxin-antitoxin system HicB family antitoxin [Planctomycetaceae bacterium]